jgi:hypothetical protein
MAPRPRPRRRLLATRPAGGWVGSFGAVGVDNLRWATRELLGAECLVVVSIEDLPQGIDPAMLPDLPLERLVGFAAVVVIGGQVYQVDLPRTYNDRQPSQLQSGLGADFIDACWIRPESLRGRLVDNQIFVRSSHDGYGG